MIKIKALAIHSLFLTIMFTPSLFSSVSIASQSPISKKVSLLICDIEKLRQEIERLNDINVKAIYTNRKSIEKSFKKLLDVDSPLMPFPLLAIETYENFIKALEILLSRDEEKAPYLLQVWSYIVGIPVVGLKHGRTYYERDNHLLPEATKKECRDLEIIIDTPQFCVRIPAKEGQEERHTHHDMPSEVSLSALVCQEKCLKDPTQTEIQESQRIGWPLLEDQLVALDRWESSNLADFMRNTLCKVTAKKKLVYSYGLISLWQHTAIYFSLKEGTESDVIVSPCSKNIVGYFGFQDGVFIEQGTLREGSYHALFGKQFMQRGLFTKNPCETSYPKECDVCKTILKALYEPHFSFELLNAKGLEQLQRMRTLGNYEALTRAFTKDFCEFCEKGDGADTLSKKLIRYIDTHQRTTVLSEINSVEPFLFNPTFRVELSRYVGNQNDDDSRNLNASELIEALIGHLQCVEHQDTQSIDLSSNGLGDEEIETLAEAFNTNIVPNLITLKLAHNKISRKGLLALTRLLKRDTFKMLVLDSNRVRTLPAELGRVSHKVYGLKNADE